ncbi:MAG: sensor histidine kinase [Nitrospira sp.]|nr:sensor histidine kinase [Nitrospira sp.]
MSGPVPVALRSSPTIVPADALNIEAVLVEGRSVLKGDASDTRPWVPIATRLLSMALVAIPVWYFMAHLERDKELKRLNAGLQARTSELAAVNESLVAEVSERKRTEQSLEASRRDLRQLTSQLLRVQEEERQRISRDLHDDINQRLALLAVDIEALEQTLSTAPIDVVRTVRAIEDRVNELSDDVRHLAHQFHPSVLDDLGLSIALQRLLDDFTARTAVRGEFIDCDTPKPLPQEVATCLYRLAQESLRNVSRHAEAKQVRIELARLRDGLQLQVSDNGVGFDQTRQHDKHEGLGFVSMKERVALVGGTLDIQSVPGTGTRVCAWVPLEKIGWT